MATEIFAPSRDTNSSALETFPDNRTAPVLGGPPDLALRLLREYEEMLQLPLACVELRKGTRLWETGARTLPVVPERLLTQLSDADGVRIFELPSGLILFALPLPACGGAPTAALGYVLAQPGVRPCELVLAAADAGWTEAELEALLAELPSCSAAILTRLLKGVWNQVRQRKREASLRHEIDDMAAQLEYTYEEICLLHALTHNLQISRAPRELAEMGLERLHGLIKAEGKAIWLDDGKGAPRFLVQGDFPCSEAEFLRLVERFGDYDWSRPLVKNRLRHSPVGVEFPGLESLILAPIAEGTRRFGWICCCNLADGREFGTVEARLISSVASILGTHGSNIDLYRQHDELLLSFVRSLVSSLDAKDPYTRGHSERVALIARCLGEKLGLPEEELQQIYLSGLLHDIGKIGVDDTILRKPGQLTEAEFEQVQRHPIIGYNILSGLKNLHAVIPGVRHHHEAFSGKGYPDGLSGDQIPLMARIIAVADSYDAMGSDRPYRNGLPLAKLDEILRRGAGQQWDPAVIAAYCEVKDRIREICESYSPAAGNSVLPTSHDHGGDVGPGDNSSELSPAFECSIVDDELAAVEHVIA